MKYMYQYDAGEDCCDADGNWPAEYCNRLRLNK